MKNLNVGFFFSTLILLAVSCSKTNDPAANKPTKCLVSKYTYSDGSFSREAIYTYNSSDQVNKVNATASNGFSGEGTVTYDANSKTIKIEGTLLAPSNDYEIYTLDDKNLFIRYERFAPSGGLNYKSEYTYNSFDQRTSKTNFGLMDKNGW